MRGSDYLFTTLTLFSTRDGRLCQLHDIPRTATDSLKASANAELKNLSNGVLGRIGCLSTLIIERFRHVDRIGYLF